MYTMKADLSTTQRRQSGVTLLELMIVLGVVGILGVLAYPAYTDYIIRSNRAAAKSFLLQVADRQEQFFGDTKSYAANLTQLGYASDAFSIDKRGAPLPAADPDGIYSLSLTNTTATTFTANAAPMHRQAARDVDCLTLTLTHTGLRGQTGAATNCW
jgi:type IV pilus assembly protein PilE